jgi:transcriptional regulator with XRE-family HTH domain
METLNTKSFEMLKLKQIRKALGLTQHEIAKKIQKTTNFIIKSEQISHYENNRVKSIGVDRIAAIERWVILNWKLSNKPFHVKP